MKSEQKLLATRGATPRPQDNPPDDSLKISTLFIGAFACLVLTLSGFIAPAQATLCRPKHVSQDHRSEANRIYDEDFGQGRYRGIHDYNARIIGCNRHRDMHGGRIKRQVNPLKHIYPQTLPPRLVKGHMKYFNHFPMRYAYRLERNNGDWILTSVARFHFPANKFPNRLDIPIDLADELNIRNTICDSTQYKNIGGIDRGLIEVDGDPVACRLNRQENLGGTPITEHLMEYWRSVIEAFWTRPGFEVRMLITNIDDLPDNELREYERRNTIWDVRLNHNKTSRAMYKAAFLKPHPLYVGLDAGTIVHEFGHVIGMDDEYPGSRNPPPHRDCNALGGEFYIMCRGIGDSAGQAKGVYAWIATRRYEIGKDTTVTAWQDVEAAEPETTQHALAGTEDEGKESSSTPRPFPEEQLKTIADKYALPGQQHIDPAAPGESTSDPGVLGERRSIPAYDEDVRDLATRDQSRDIADARPAPTAAAEPNPELSGSDEKGDLPETSAAMAGKLIAQYPLDGSPESAAGPAGIVIAPDTPPQPVSGRFGQAYHFEEKATIAAPLDIDFQTHPQLTITAWIRLDKDHGSGGYLVSSGRGGRTPRLMLSNDHVRGGLGGRSPTMHSVSIPVDTWTFVAGVWDATAKTMRLHAGDGSETFTNEKFDPATLADDDRQPLFRLPDDADPRRYVFIGAHDPNGGSGVTGVAIDDVRIYAGALDETTIAAVRRAETDRDGGTSVAGNRRIGETEKNLPGRADTSTGGPAFDQDQAHVPDVAGHGETGDGSANNAPIYDAVDPQAVDTSDQIGKLPEMTGVGDDGSSASGGDTGGDPQHTVVFDGTSDPGRTRYTLRASGPLKQVEGQLDGMTVTINPDDTLDGTGRNARGYVGDARDGYHVYGSVEDISLQNPSAADVYVDGKRVDMATGKITRRQGLSPNQDGGDNQGPDEQRKPTGWHLSEETHRSDVTGRLGQSRIPLQYADKTVRVIRFGEQNNKPCEIYIDHSTNERWDSDTAKQYDRCKSGEFQFQSTEIFFDRPIGGIAVCTSPGKQRRVKGLEVRGSRIEADGSFGAFKQLSEERRNCRNWERLVICDRNSVATGVVAHFQNNPGIWADYIVGLQLICRRIVPEYSD